MERIQAVDEGALGVISDQGHGTAFANISISIPIKYFQDSMSKRDQNTW
jgi:hypothetical protein